MANKSGYVDGRQRDYPTISHLFQNKFEFRELASCLRELSSPRQQLYVWLDGILSSESVKNLYMAFELFEEFYPQLPFMNCKGEGSFNDIFDEAALNKLVRFKTRQRCCTVHPHFLCELVHIKNYGQNVLDKLLRCEDLVSSSHSKRVECLRLVPSVEFILVASDHWFRFASLNGDMTTFTVKLVPGLMSEFDMQLVGDESGSVTADNVHLIFQEFYITEEENQNPFFMHFLSWHGKPGYNMQRDDPRQYEWGDLFLSKGGYIRLIAFVTM